MIICIDNYKQIELGDMVEQHGVGVYVDDDWDACLVYINKEQAQQIVDHLTAVFNLGDNND